MAAMLREFALPRARAAGGRAATAVGYVLHSITLKFSAKGHGTIIDGTIIENCTVPYRILYCTVPYTVPDPGSRRLEAVRLRLGRRLGRGRGARYEDRGHKVLDSIR